MSQDSPLGETAKTPSPCSLGRLFAIWLSIGAQSFGGGAATLVLIQRASVEREKWVTPEEFVRLWGLCQIAPGINLFCLTILLGKRVGGAGGVLLAILGLVLPSVGLTLIMTAFYASWRNHPYLKAALRGMVPATVGLGVLATAKALKPYYRQSQQEGAASMGVTFVIFVASGIVIATGKLAVLAAILIAGCVGAVVFSALQAKHESALKKNPSD